ncbi:S4 domain-containing protein YaaA [Lutispora saccharofermentans]|uniref:S4 domain-containing protein YaaA n=1 Tax=Lutispora saccharofermentans TaxID=3024236 RepID=A0ABT1NK91_9FIRM|nr:S4 domain-containing protein YaaA [Lutispora saccharofermentans]
MLEIKIDTEYIKLDQFLKFAGLVNTGGEAKNIIMEGRITVNGSVEKARGKKLRADDIIEFEGHKYKIV